MREKASFKELHAVWFHLFDILRKTNYSDGEQISGCQGLGIGGDYEGTSGQSCLSWVATKNYSQT